MTHLGYGKVPARPREQIEILEQNEKHGVRVSKNVYALIDNLHFADIRGCLRERWRLHHLHGHDAFGMPAEPLRDLTLSKKIGSLGYVPFPISARRRNSQKKRAAGEAALSNRKV